METDKPSILELKMGQHRPFLLVAIVVVNCELKDVESLTASQFCAVCRDHLICGSLPLFSGTMDLQAVCYMGIVTSHTIGGLNC